MELTARALEATKAEPKSGKQKADDGRWVIREMAQTIRQIEDSEQMYNLTEDEDILEYYIYTRKALQAKYRFLLHTARRQGITLNNLPTPK